MSDAFVSLCFIMSDTYFLLHIFLFNYKYSYNLTVQLLVFFRYHLSVISIPSILTFSSPILPFNYWDHFYLPLLPSIFFELLGFLSYFLSFTFTSFHITFELLRFLSYFLSFTFTSFHITFELIGFLSYFLSFIEIPHIFTV